MDKFGYVILLTVVMECRVICITIFYIGYAHTLDNLSLHKTASMSTSLHADKWLAAAAVDGNTDQSLDGNSCAVTSDNYHKVAWLKVNLGAVSSITAVKIYYRDEDDGITYTYRLSGFKIYVSNDSSTLGTAVYINNGGVQDNPRPPSVSTFPCEATGQYVTIYKSRADTCTSSSGHKGFCARLELCEVQVLGSINEDDRKTKGDNLSLHKTASMSSSLHADKWLAAAAVDGNTDQSLDGNSCAVTSDDYKVEAWWKVDLGAVSSFTEVKIYYRDEGDGNSYTYRLSGFTIFVSNDSSTSGSTVYINNGGVQSNPGPPSVSTFPCEATGQYVTIYKSRADTCTSSSSVPKIFCTQLELCEVQVLGIKEVDDKRTTASNGNSIIIVIVVSIIILSCASTMVIAFLLYRRRKNRKRKGNKEETDPTPEFLTTDNIYYEVQLSNLAEQRDRQQHYEEINRGFTSDTIHVYDSLQTPNTPEYENMRI